MRIVFMGSALLSCPALRMLLTSTSDEVVALVTQPDRPRGRGRKVFRSPVREELGDVDLPVLTPENINASESVVALRELAPELIVVIAYGQILKSDILSLPQRGCLNIHASLLPKYRGAAPIQWAIVNGEKTTGLSTMYMNEATDEGDVVQQQTVQIDDTDTAGSLHDKLAEAGAGLLAKSLELIRSNHAQRVAQDHSEASYAPKLKKSDGRIVWTMSATDIYNRVRGFNPWPGAHCEVPKGSGRFLKVLRARVEEADGSAPGSVTAWGGDGPVVQTGEGAIRLVELQPADRRAMDGDAYTRGHERVEQFG